MGKVIITLKIDPELLEMLKKIAKTKHMTMGEIIRKAVNEYIARHRDELEVTWGEYIRKTAKTVKIDL